MRGIVDTSRFGLIFRHVIVDVLEIFHFTNRDINSLSCCNAHRCGFPYDGAAATSSRASDDAPCTCSFCLARSGVSYSRRRPPPVGPTSLVGCVP